MNFNDLLTKLIYLTKRNNITNSDIGRAIQLDRQAMSGRASRNTNFKDKEVEQIENYFSINFSDVHIQGNSLKRHYNESIETKNCCRRIAVLQNRNKLSNMQMAGLLDISETEFSDIASGKITPDTAVLDNLKKNFEVSIDWLLYGE